MPSDPKLSVGTLGGCLWTVYSQGWQATMLRIRELVDKEYNIEYASIVRLEKLLAPDLDELDSL